MKNMTRDLANYSIREEKLDGKDYLVAPIVALAEGVHTGMDKIPTLYLAEDIGKFVDDWNGTPVVVYHTNASARTPDNVERRVIGQMFNSTFDPDGAKLRSEVWIDVDKAKKIAPAVLNILRSGRNLEVSHSSFGKAERTSGVWKDEPYAEIWRDLRPDHLALLPGAEGACSYADGCGVRNNSGGGDVKRNIRSSARSPSYDGTESTSWGNVTKTFAAYAQAYLDAHGGGDAPATVADAPSAMKNWIASKTLLGEGDADNERDLMFFPVVNPGTGKLNEGALRAVISGRGEAADIPDGAKASAQNKARALLEEHFDYEPPKEQSRFAKLGSAIGSAVTGVLERFGVKLETISHDQIREKLNDAVRMSLTDGSYAWVTEVFDSDFVYELTPYVDGAPDGPTKFFRRAYEIDDGGAVTLGTEVAEVERKVEYAPVNERADNSEPEAPDDTEVKMEKKALVDGLIECEYTDWAEDDRETLMNLEEGVLERMKVKDEVLAKLKASDQPPEGDDPPKDDPPKDNAEPMDSGEMTVEKVLAKLPPEIGNALGSVVNVYAERKNELVTALKANERCTYTEKELQDMEVPALEKLAKLAGDPVTERRADYSARVGATVERAKSNQAPAPKLMYDLKELRKNRGTRAKATA